MNFEISEEKVKQAIASLIKTYNPLYIYSFGSYAENRTGKDSDFDVLVIVDAYDDARWRVIAQGYEDLWGIHMPIDLIVYDKAWFESCKDNHQTFCHSILKKGRLMYARQNAS